MHWIFEINLKTICKEQTTVNRIEARIPFSLRFFIYFPRHVAVFGPGAPRSELSIFFFAFYYEVCKYFQRPLSFQFCRFRNVFPDKIIYFVSNSLVSICRVA